MKRTLWIWRCALLALSLSAADATAQFRSWTVCGGNAFSTCASVELTLTSGVATLRVWNLSGQNGTWANTVFTRVGFENVGSSVSAVAITGMTGTGVNNPAQWVIENDREVGGGVNLDLVTGTPNNQGNLGGINSGIASACGNPGITSYWVNPCTPPAAAGWVTLTFTYTGSWNLDDTYLLVKGQNGPNGASTECITGGANPNCSVVPEPVSMVLLGTGLAGLGGVGALRRKRRGLDIENG